MFSRIVENIWNTLVEIYEELSSESTIHGIKHTTRAKSTCARFFWVSVLIGFLLTSVEFAKLFYNRHQSASMRTLIISDQFPTSQLALPAITVCSGTLAVTQKVHAYLTSQKRIFMPRGLSQADFLNSMKYLRELIFPKNHFPEELEKLQQILSANRLTVLDLLEAISPNCSELLIMCRFEGVSQPCENFAKSILTHYGICCAFNYVPPDEEKDKSTILYEERKSAISGQQFIFSILMKPITSNDRISSWIYGDGIKVIVHERYTQPTTTALEFVAATGHETIVRLYGVLSTSSAEILNLPPATRNCFSSSMTHMYRAENCYMRCRETVIQKLCGCVLFYSININNRDTLCNLDHIPCLARMILKVDKLIMHDPHCTCLPDCEAIKYDVSITALPLSGAQYRPGLLYDRAQQIENATMLHIAFTGQSGVWERNELMLSKINLMSSLGGVFSLFLGCSFISILEIIYFVIIHLIRKFRSFRRVVHNE